MVPREFSWEKTEMLKKSKNMISVLFISPYNANIVPMLLPVPPFQFFGIMLLLSSVINGAPENIQQAAILHNAGIFIRLVVKELGILSFQLLYSRDADIDQVVGNGNTHSRDP